jgi:hypothetical protein
MLFMWLCKNDCSSLYLLRKLLSVLEVFYWQNLQVGVMVKQGTTKMKTKYKFVIFSGSAF